MKIARASHQIYWLLLFLINTVSLAWADSSLSSEYGTEPEFVEDDSVINRHRTPITSYSPALKKVIPYVVGIYTDLDNNKSHIEILDSENNDKGIGSGVIIDSHGFIITNSHVILKDDDELAEKVSVELSSGETLTARIVAVDRATDLAIIKVARHFESAAVLGDSSNLEFGDIVFAIGNPLSVGLTVTMGIVSAKGRTSLGILGYGSYENFIQTDAAINFGNSGGPLVDAEGRVIGINTAMLSKNGYNTGIGFSIPINLAKKIAYDLITYGVVIRGGIGVLPVNLNPSIRSTFALPDNLQGVFVKNVPTDLPAYKAGIKAGDIILKVNGSVIETAEELRLTISQIMPGSLVQLEIYRLGQIMNKEIQVTSLNEKKVKIKKRELPDVHIIDLTTEYLVSNNISEELEGVVITDQKNGASPTNILQKGMIILEINDRPVKETSKIPQLLKKGSNQLYVWHKGNKQFIRVFID